jgi:hypothetical protein
VDQTGRHTAEKIEDEISNMTEPVFNVISEDIEKPHVHDDMKESSVKEHGGQKRESLFESGKVNGNLRVGISEGYHSIKVENFLQFGPLSDFP